MDYFTFTKMHALGNNYIYVDMFKENLSEDVLSNLAIRVSNVHTGIGSDGMILICPSDIAPVKMRIFNNDGSEGKNCGNGLRCVAKYAFENKIVSEKNFKIETLSGLVDAEIHEKAGEVYSVTVNMGNPRLRRKDLPMIGLDSEMVVNEQVEFSNQSLYMTGVSMGNPHAIFYVDNIEDAPLTTLGPIIEKDSRFPEGVNVEFLEVLNETEINFRVWERGSGITQACGTGACAAVVASCLNGKTKRNQQTTVHLAGGDLFITWTDQGHVLMTGPAEVVCTGTYYYNK